MSDIEEIIHPWRFGNNKLPDGLADLKSVCSIVSGGGYDWEEFRVFWSPTARMYFWLGEAGCSCNGWGDALYSLSEMENGQAKSDVIRAIRAWASDAYSVTAAEVLDAMNELANFTPEAA